jgi:nitrite reductase/ring-hydroxylating ferredoxin subunit
VRAERIRVCSIDELPPGARQVIATGNDEEVLVLNAGGTIYAISNSCPHEGAALERGMTKNGVLFCPLHRWGFVLVSGACMQDATLCAHTYEIETHDGQLFLRLS